MKNTLIFLFGIWVALLEVAIWAHFKPLDWFDALFLLGALLAGFLAGSLFWIIWFNNLRD